MSSSSSSSSVLLCCGRCCRVRVNSLWLWWYAPIVAAGQAYLMYRAVRQCQQYNELSWRADDKPVAELYAYICLLVVSIMCLPFFVLTAVVKVGNYANDGVRLGRDVPEPTFTHENGPSDDLAGTTGEAGGGAGGGGGEGGGGGGGDNYGTASFWKHGPPLCNYFHILAAFTLLLPRILLDAQKIQHGFLPPDDIWRSELEVLFGRGKPGDMAPADTSATSGGSGNQSALFDPAVAPPGASNTKQGSMRVLEEDLLPVSPEFVNWVLALIIYSLRYPAVFWYTKRMFSMLFAFLLFAAAFQYVLAYGAVGVLYKFRVNAGLYASPGLVLPSGVMIVLYLLTNTFVFASAIAVFNYGYLHFLEAHRKLGLQQRLRRPRRKLTPPPAAAAGCQGYVPHSVATITLMLFVASRATLVYDAVALYRASSSGTLLASVVWDVTYMLLWLITWFVLTIKQEWGFHVRVPTIDDVVYTIRNEHARDSGLFAENVASGSGNHGSRSSTAAAANIMDENAEGVVITNGAVSQGGARGRHDTSAGDSPPGSPTSAFRKSGSGRGNVRVTFEEEEDDVDGSRDTSDGGDMQRHGQRRRSREGKGTPSRRRKRKQEAEMVDDRPKNVFGDFPLQETPENTLTRTYRHSIRDKCGQYYRHSREFQSPPAAQSSPVLAHRKSDNAPPTVPPPDDLPLRELPPRDLPPRDPISSRELPLRDFAQREGMAHRRSGSYEPERQPPPRPARNSSPGRAAVAAPHNLAPLAADRRGAMPHKQSHPHSSKKPSSHHRNPGPPLTDSSYPWSTSFQAPTPGGATAGAPPSGAAKNYPTGMVRNNLSSKPPPSGGSVGARGSDRQSSRELRIVAGHAAAASMQHGKKPEMGRRDSALPSSNETSSNDSTDNVLCSQV